MKFVAFVSWLFFGLPLFAGWEAVTERAEPLPATGLLDNEITVGRITYTGKVSNITDFRGYGQHLYYFPAFNLNAPDNFHRTDSDSMYFNRVFEPFLHHVIFPLDRRTFSADAGGSPRGVKARGGHDDWATFTLPNGQVGLSGTIYDDATRSNSNNSINQINLNRNSPTQFCLNIITDNTNLENIPDGKLEARNTTDDLVLKNHPDLTFDGKPDMYTFRYVNMGRNEKIKIRMLTTKPANVRATGAGLAGIMISDFSTCAP